MNVQRREGFIDPQQTESDKPPTKTIEATAEKPHRAMPPPEIDPSPAEADTARVADEWPITIKLLYKPIRNNRGDMIKEVQIREPRAGDIARYGNPIRVNQDGDVLIEERKMTYMIAALAGVLEPFVEDMDPRDWASCAYRLRRFFLPDPAAW
jgi:hypothetical protein